MFRLNFLPFHFTYDTYILEIEIYYEKAWYVDSKVRHEFKIHLS